MASGHPDHRYEGWDSLFHAPDRTVYSLISSLRCIWTLLDRPTSNQSNESCDNSAFCPSMVQNVSNLSHVTVKQATKTCFWFCSLDAICSGKQTRLCVCTDSNEALAADRHLKVFSCCVRRPIATIRANQRLFIKADWETHELREKTGSADGLSNPRRDRFFSSH